MSEHRCTYDDVRCPVCGHPWGEHTAECSRHDYRPGAEKAVYSLPVLPLGKYYAFRDGSGICRDHSLQNMWNAWWSDGTPLRDEDDEISFFASPEEALAVLVEAGFGPAAGEVAK